MSHLPASVDAPAGRAQRESPRLIYVNDVISIAYARYRDIVDDLLSPSLPRLFYNERSVKTAAATRALLPAIAGIML